MCQAYAGVFDGGRRIPGIRNEDAGDIAAPVYAHQVGRDFLAADGLLPPLHFDQVDNAVDFDNAVNLLDDAVAVFFNGEGVADEEPREGKQIVQRAFELLTTLVWVCFREESVQIRFQCLASLILFPLRLNRRVVDCLVLLAFLLALQIDAGETVLDVDNSLNLRNQPLCLKAVIVPAAGEIVEGWYLLDAPYPNI